MRKIRIKVKATTANLGIGFDFLGLALNIYNIYELEESDCFDLYNFSIRKENNLLLTSYKKVFDLFKREYVPLRTTEISRDIPISRGLGSSASLIVAGVLAANYFGSFNLDDTELVKIMTSIEGHPDNVAPAFFGGLVSTIVLEDDKVLTFSHKISDRLNFYVYIPDYEVKTIEARCALPKTLPFKDITHNASRAFVAKDALEKGDINLLKIALDDCIHEPYREPLIKEFTYFKKFYKNENVIVRISGSGSTILFITDEKLTNQDLRKVDVDYSKTSIMEI